MELPGCIVGGCGSRILGAQVCAERLTPRVLSVDGGSGVDDRRCDSLLASSSLLPGKPVICHAARSAATSQSSLVQTGFDHPHAADLLLRHAPAA
jgi:hypothetical protein